MNPRHNGSAQFRVRMSAVVAEQLAAIYRRAEPLGRAADVAAAARRIDYRLRNDPRVFGEPVAPLAAAGLELRRGAVAPVVVYYAVHQSLPEVFVRSFLGMLGGP